MDTTTRSSSSRLGGAAQLVCLFTGVIALSAAGSAVASGRDPGVVLDPGRDVVYLMSPDDEVEAVATSSGRLLWSTAEAAKPLAVDGDLVIAQRPPSGSGGVLEIAVLDRNSGRLLRTIPLSLGHDARAAIDDGMGTRFVATADVRAGVPVVFWEQTVREIRGAAPLPDEEQPSRQLSGAYRLDLEAGTAVAVEAHEVRNEPELPAAVVQWQDLGTRSWPAAWAGEVIAVISVFSEGESPRVVLRRWHRGMAAALPEIELFRGDLVVEFLSADDQAVAIVERVAPGEWEEYSWSVFSLESGGRLGQLSESQSYAWSVVDGSTLIYVAQPYSRRIAEERVDEPKKLRAVRLDGGRTLWERPLRDTSYRGPLPP